MALTQTTCPHCGNILSIHQEWIGQQLECSLCHKKFVAFDNRMGGGAPPPVPSKVNVKKLLIILGSIIGTLLLAAVIAAIIYIPILEKQEFLEDNGIALNDEETTVTGFYGRFRSYCALPDYVTCIGAKAFADSEYLEEVVIPGSVTVIGDEAFSGCSKLQKISLAGIKNIGAKAFYNCSSLQEVTLPDTLESLGEQAFGGISGLKITLSVSTFFRFKKLLPKAEFHFTGDLDGESPENLYDLAQYYYGRKNKEKFLFFLEKASGKEHPEAMVEYGKYFLMSKNDKAKSFPLFKKAADKGNTRGEFFAGSALLYGIGTGKNLPQAVELLRKAAEKNNPAAQYHLGICYRDGSGVSRDQYEAFQWFKKAAENNDPHAQFQLAGFYENGTAGEKDPVQAYQWYSRAKDAASGNIPLLCEIHYHLGRCLEYGIGVKKDPAKALTHYQFSAIFSHPEACYILAECYRTGRCDQSRDLKEAFENYRKAAEKGHTQAQYQLGVFYRDGITVSSDTGKAAEYFAQAAEKGLAEAQNDLGVLYDNGTVSPADKHKAFEFFAKAAAQGLGVAQFNLGKMYENGSGCQRNLAEALKYYNMAAAQKVNNADQAVARCRKQLDLDNLRSAAEKGDPESLYQLAVSLCDSSNGKFKMHSAIKYFTQAAEKGSSKAQKALADIYFNGKGTDKNYYAAFKWSTKAAENGGDPEIWTYLGQMYEHGWGCEKNNKEAESWYTKAAAEGYAPAVRLLEKYKTVLAEAEKIKAAEAGEVKNGRIFFARLRDNLTAEGGKWTTSRKARFGMTGKVKAIKFPGIPNQGISYSWDAITGNDPRSVSLWFYCDGYNQYDGGNAMLSYGRKIHDQYFDIETNASRALICAWGEDAGAYAKNIRNQRWNHVVITHNGQYRICYLNGKVTAKHKVYLQTAGSRLMIGTRLNDINHCFVGSIRNVAVYKRALTETEVLQLLKNGLD